MAAASAPAVDDATWADLLPTVSTLLREAVGADELSFDTRLSSMGRWRIGGPADIVVTPKTRASLAETLKIVASLHVPHVVIGDGSNLLFDDDGFRGLVIRVGRAFGGMTAGANGAATAGAGMWVPCFVRRTIDAGLAGAVHAIGIPGTLGGLVTMNGGSQRHGIGENIVAVEAMDYAGTLHRLTHDDLNFAYRQSRLQDGRLIMLSADFQFTPGDRAALHTEAVEILGSRRRKFPKVRANCGSVFVSDPKLYSMIGPPGMAIEKAGLKGTRIGDAQISPEHANFFVNVGNARSADILRLIGIARRRVHDLTGVAMIAEVRHLDPSGVLRPAHEVADLLTDHDLDIEGTSSDR